MAIYILMTVSVMYSLRILSFYFDSTTPTSSWTPVVHRDSFVYNDKINWKKEGF